MSRHNRKQRYEPIKDYLDFTDLVKKAGYKVYEPRLGNVGRALLQACSGTNKDRYHRSIGWLKHQLDTCLKSNQSKEKGYKKRNELQK